MLPLMAASLLLAPVPAEAAPQAADGLHPLASLVGSLGCLSVIVLLGVMMLRRRDLLDVRAGLLLLAFLAALAAVHLLPAATLLGLFAQRADQAAGLAALVAVLAALGLWPLLPRLVGLANPVALQREVEERRQAEALARASEVRARDAERRMAELLAHVPEALFVLRVDRAGKLAAETANPAFERIFGHPVAGLQGAPPETLMPAPVAAQLRRCWHHHASRGETAEAEVVAELQGGQRCLQMTLVPMRGVGGVVDHVLGSVRDVTATRRLQQGLVQSARLATVGTICAGLAHEASQPLNTAALWLRRARAAVAAVPEAERAPVLRAVQVVDDQVLRAGDLVARMRALADEEPRVMDCFDAAKPVAAAIRLVAARHAADGITLSLRGTGLRLGVRGSAARLEQALLQLLSNARDAVLERRRVEPRAPARIEVVLRRSPTIVMIEVRDSGAGVPEALADRIFDPFFTTKEPGRGTGLGLAFVAAVARGLGGGIETWNLPGGGACFRMELAAVEPRHAARDPRRAQRADAHAA